MKTVIEMAREVGLLTIGTADGSEAVYTWPKGITEELERFAEIVRADSRNATLDEIANKIAAMPFGNTAASFAVWIREQKTKTCPPCHGDCNQGRACPARGSHA